MIKVLLGWIAQPNKVVLTILVWLAGESVAWTEDWPQWMGPQRDGVWRESGILRKFPPNGPKVLWRAPLGAGYAGPAVAEGRVYVCDRVEGQAAGDPGQERVLCLDEENGRVLWKFEYDCDYKFAYPAGPRTTPAVAGGKVYTLGAAAHLYCFEAATGKVIWSRELKEDYRAKTPIWGFAAHPLVDGQKLICVVGGQGSLVVAFDKDTGKELWRALEAKDPGYSPPVIYEAGGKRQLIIFNAEGLTSLDPETGKTYWHQPYTTQYGLTVSMPRKLDDLLLVTSFYNGPMMMRLASDRPAASLAWKGKSSSEVKTDGLHSIISTPFLEGNLIYGVCSYGQLRCLKAQTGERVWETLAATTTGKPVRWANAFLIKNGDVFFLPNERGDLMIARLNENGYEELDRAPLIEPTNRDCGRLVVWSHPAFANRSVFARNDREIIRVSLADPSAPASSELKLREDVLVRELTPGVWLHTTFFNLPQYGRVPANGLVIIDGADAALIDLPWTDQQTGVLMDWISKERQATVRAVVPTHSHQDCSGGLGEAHRRGAESWALDQTMALARKAGQPVPQHGFANATNLHCGQIRIELAYLGAGHTVDNIVAWIPGQQVLFAGCLVKAANATNLGNTQESDLAAYPKTLRQLKQRYGSARIVVPGHGRSGGVELIDHTLSLSLAGTTTSALSTAPPAH